VKGCQIKFWSRPVKVLEFFILLLTSERKRVGLGTANPPFYFAVSLIPNNREKWIVLSLLWWVCLLNYADRQAISSLFPLLERDFGFSKAQLGLIGSAFMWVYAASAPLAGYAGDRLNRKGLILGGCLFWSLMTAATGWCGKLWQFVGARSLIGLGESVYFPAAASLLSDHHDARTRSTALSFHQSAVYVGTIAGGWLGAEIAEHYGWRWTFYAFGGVGILLSIVLLLRLREMSNREMRHGATESLVEPPKAFLHTFAGLISRSGIFLLAAAFALANGVSAIFLIWAPTFLFEKFHLGLVAAGFSAVAAIQVACAVSAPISGLLADKLSPKLRGARMLVQGMALLMGTLCVVMVGAASTLPLLLAAMLCFGLCKGAYDGGIFASVFEFVDSKERGSVVGLMNLCGWGGGALGPLLVGIVSSGGSGAAQMALMGVAISWSGLAYLGAAGLILAALKIYRAESSPH
jgi:MFS family permease